MPDYLRVLENAIQFGNPVLLQNVQEDLDLSLNPILNKSLTRIGQTHASQIQTELSEVFLFEGESRLVCVWPVFSPPGDTLLLKLGDKELEYNPEFRFYITTKLSNPRYTPEISSKTTIVNFAVKEQVFVTGRVFSVFTLTNCLTEGFVCRVLKPSCWELWCVRSVRSWKNRRTHWSSALLTARKVSRI